MPSILTVGQIRGQRSGWCAGRLGGPVAPHRLPRVSFSQGHSGVVQGLGGRGDRLEPDLHRSPGVDRRAACQGRTELFFAPAGERPEARVLRGARGPLASAARARRRACRRWAREHREYGFWGGESEEDRAARRVPGRHARRPGRALPQGQRQARAAPHPTRRVALLGGSNAPSCRDPPHRPRETEPGEQRDRRRATGTRKREYPSGPAETSTTYATMTIATTCPNRCLRSRTSASTAPRAPSSHSTRTWNASAARSARDWSSWK